ncbi:MAG: peptidylprolyl isomerase [Planctomycetota bacterium]|nr:peptidylprolyl isomerase [Planctomycetota bacterium]
MPIKTNRIPFFFSILFATFSFFCDVGQVAIGQEGRSLKSKLGAAKAASKQTPEERAAEQQKKLELQNEVARNRLNSFGILPTGDESEAGKKYQAAFNAFRLAAIDLNQVQVEFHLTTQFTEEFRQKINNDWKDAIHKSFVAKTNWITVAGETFASDPEKYLGIGATLCEMMIADVELDRTDGWLNAAKAITLSRKFESEEVLRAACLIAYANADFDFTEQCLHFQKEMGSSNKFLGEISTVREKWQRELEIRKLEAEKNDNPRVEFLTTKGKLVIELYEDAAPETVKSFMYLVERGYYKRKSFFRVEKHLCAQTGCEKGDGTGDAGYTIPGEADLPGHRDHFRGTLAIALGSDEKTGKVLSDTGSSQFYISFLPAPNLDGRYTVFGRVIEGIETMSFFRVMNLGEEAQRKEEKQPDIVLDCKVIRKRSTEYKPKIVAGKLPR